MISTKYLAALLLSILMLGCEVKLKNTWQSRAHINAFNEEEGVSLFIEGERLNGGLKQAEITFALNQDLISGGYKQIFTFNLNGSTSWGEDYVEVITPQGESFIFEVYDGLLFNIDYESNEISRFIELMNNDHLVIHSGKFEFTISTREFMKLYTENFLQPTA